MFAFRVVHMDCESLSEFLSEGFHFGFCGEPLSCDRDSGYGVNGGCSVAVHVFIMLVSVSVDKGIFLEIQFFQCVEGGIFKF